MSKRILRVLKWLGTSFVVGVCTACAQEFAAAVIRATASSNDAGRLAGSPPRFRIITFDFSGLGPSTGDKNYHSVALERDAHDLIDVLAASPPWCLCCLWS